MPLSATVREHAPALATGLSWMAIGGLSLVVGRLEGLPPPERANLGAGVAWLVGLSLVAAGALLFSWALLRISWWSRLQRHGRAAEAVVARAEPVSWFHMGGSAPVDLELHYEDAAGRPRVCRVRLRQPRRRPSVRCGDILVVVHSAARPEQAVLYWKR